MSSLNNQSSQITAAVANDQRQVVKKLTIGVSSMLLGFAFAGATAVHADTNTQLNNSTEHISTVNDNQSITDNSAQILKTAPASPTQATNSATNATVASSSSVSAVSAASIAATSSVNSPSADTTVTSASDVASDAQQASTAAASYETAVKANMAKVVPTSTSASSSAQSGSAVQAAASTASQVDGQTQSSAAMEEPTVAAVPMTNYEVQPYGQAQREANAQAGLKIATDFVNILTASSITAKIGQGITFIKDTINLITRHPLAYQRYQNMTARQMRLANRQHDLALKQKQMEIQHKPQWQINFVISQQRWLASRQQRLAIQRQTMVGYLRANNNISNYAFA